MIVKILFFALCLALQACLLSGNNSTAHNFDGHSDAAQLNVEITEPCIVTQGSPATSFTPIFGEKTEYLQPDLSDCRITVTRSGTDAGSMQTDLRAIARTITYFCNDKTSPPPHMRKITAMQLCDAARTALGNFVVILQATKFATVDEQYAKNKDFLASCYQPEVIDIDKIPNDTNEFIKLYPNEGKCPSSLPIRAYMTYIYTHLNEQLHTEMAMAANAHLKTYQITYDTVRHWYKMRYTEKFDSMFMTGYYGLKTHLVHDIARQTYWHTCFTIVRKFFEQLGIDTSALTGNFYSSTQPQLATFKPTHEYSLFGNYSAKYVIDPTAAAEQLEEIKSKMLQQLSSAIDTADKGKSKDEVATEVSARIKKYITAVKQARQLVDKVGLTSYPN